MWQNVVTVLVLALLAVWIIEWFLSRVVAYKVSPRNVIKEDAAPIIGFIGVVLLALSLVEAVRSDAVIAWGMGVIFGLIASASMYAALIYRVAPPIQTRAGGWRSIIQFARAYGAIVLLVILGISLAVRVVGPMLEVFVVGAMGSLVVAMAVTAYAISKGKQTLH